VQAQLIGPLVPHHSLLVPVAHKASSLDLSAAEAAEVRSYVSPSLPPSPHISPSLPYLPRCARTSPPSAAVSPPEASQSVSV